MEDKEKRRIWRKRWRDKNKERISEYNRAYNKAREKKPSKKRTKEQNEKYKKYQREYHSEYQKGRGREKYLLRSRAQVYFRDKIISERKKCEECGSMNNLELHHKNYEENTMSNIKLLCRSCHKVEHSGRSITRLN